MILLYTSFYVQLKSFLGVPACCAAQSACYGLRYRFGALHHATHALRMPNAKEVFFVGFRVYPPTRPQGKMR